MNTKGILMIKTILFDLDGTLLPMDQDIFVEKYFGALGKKFASLGYDGEKSVKTVWHAIGKMFKNNGEQTNEELFWKVLSGIFDKSDSEAEIFNDFYKFDFQELKNYCSFNKESAEIVKDIKKAGYRVVLATNPVFPSIATESRIRWAGLEPEYFEFITTYENIGYCKPNPYYYSDIAKKLNLVPEQCLMIGNDVEDDMAAEKVGMKVFLLTDCLINKKGKDISSYQKGDFKALREYLKI